jgi:transcriptional regulator with XRE-family HTH domain
MSDRQVSGRGPYARPAGRVVAGGVGQPADALAENLRAYRLLRHMTQDQLAARMAHLSHGWGRSTVSAVEGRSRNVIVDELFGLALALGVTVGQLLDPGGPDHSRQMSLDVGLRAEGTGQPQPVAPRLAHMWASSRATIRLDYDDVPRVEIDLEPVLVDDIVS